MAYKDINQIRNTLQSVRNRRECQWVCEPPATINSFNNAGSGGGSGKNRSGGDNVVVTGDVDLTTIIAELGIITSIESTTIETSLLTTFNLDVTRMSGFTTNYDSNVVLLGPADNPECNIFWDSSNCTLYVNADLVVSGDTTVKETTLLITEDPIITLGGITVYNTPPTTDFGFEFFWYDPDGGVTQNKRSFFGFDSNLKKFVAINTGVNNDEVFSDPIEYGELLLDILSVNTISQSGLIEVPLTITSVNLDIYSTENINVNSSTYIQQALDGIIFSSTGSLGIDILSLDGDIDISNTNASIFLTSLNESVNISTTGPTGEDINLNSGGSIKLISNANNISNNIDNIDIIANDSSVNIKSTSNIPNAITIDAIDGGIDITSVGEDIDICALDDASVHICSTSQNNDAITLNAINGGIDITSKSENIDITSIESDINLLSNNINLLANSSTSDAITLNAINGGIDITSKSDNVDIVSIESDINLLSTNNINLLSNFNTSNAIVLNATNGGIDISSYSEDIDICANNASVNICSNNNESDAIVINSTNGGIQIISNGEHDKDIDITAINNSINLISNENVNDAIKIQSLDGGIIMESKSEDIHLSTIDAKVQITSNFIAINDHDNLNLLSLDTVNGIQSDLYKTDYRTWIPYMRFDPGNYGIWLSERSIISGSNSIYYWKKQPNNEIAYLSCDINECIRSTSNKGFKLTKLLFSYKIENSDINSIIPTITKKTFDSNNPTSPIIITNIPFSNNNLTTGIYIGDHYRSISILSPFYINDESILTIELAIDTNNTSLFKFYGMFLEFHQNHL